MSNFGEHLPQEHVIHAFEQLACKLESCMHPKNEVATLAVCDGLVINMADQGSLFRADIHGNLPGELNIGESYRSIQVGKPPAVNHDGMLATMAIVTKLSNHPYSEDVVIDDNGIPMYLEERYGAKWGVRYIEEPQATVIAEISGMLARSSTVFLPQQELQNMFTEPNKANYRKWRSLTQPETHATSNRLKLQELLSRLALLRN